MRKLKKFKRFSEGGLGSSEGEGDPFAKKTEFDPERRERAIEGIKDFFMGRRSKDEPSAPIEERQPPKKAAKEDKAPESTQAEPAKTSPIKTPSVAQQMRDREKGGPNERANYASSGKTSRPEYDSYSYGPDNLADGNEGVDSSTSTGNAKKAEAYRQSLMPVSKPKPKPPAPAAEKTPAAPAKAPRAARPEDIPGTDVKTPYKGETIDNSNLAAKQFAQSTLGATAAGRTLGAGARGAIGLGRMFESLSKPAPKEAPRTEPTLAPSASSTTPRGGDPRAAANRRAAESETKEAPKEVPTRVDPRAAANRRAAESEGKQAPKEAPKAEPKAETKSGAIQPTGKGPSEAGKKLMEEGKGSLKDQAMEVVNKQRVATKDPRGTVRPEPRTIKPTGKGPSEAGKKLMGRTNTRSSTILEKERKPDLAMQEYISGRETARNRVKDLSDDGLSAERFANKKGGKIPAFKKGGLVGRADGCAIRGKTKGRMV